MTDETPPVRPETPDKPAPVTRETPVNPETPVQPATPVKTETSVKGVTPVKPATSVKAKTSVKRVTPVKPATASSPVTPVVDEITPWMRALAGAVRLGVAGLTRVRIEGAMDQIPREGPVIVAANHSSNLDVPVLGSSLMPKLGRRLQWLGKKEVLEWPVVGWIARNGGVHGIDRSTADIDAFRLAARILEDGHALFVFPEGTRSHDGLLGEGRDGVAVLALRTGAPIVPVGITGSYERWPRGQKLPHPGGRVTVRVGSPFRVQDLLPPGTERRAAKAQATELIMRRIAELLPERQRGRYGTTSTAG